MPQLTIQQGFALAVEHHQAGRLQEAERIYRQILTLQPGHAEALHLLGVIAHQMGRNDAAADLIGQAIALKPNYAEAHSNLGIVLSARGQLDAAIAAYRRAIALHAHYPDAQNNLGNALRDKGQVDEAIAAYRHAIALKPHYAEAHSNLGVALRDAGDLPGAVAALRQAVALDPRHADAQGNLGIALRDLGQFEEALAAIGQAIALKPNHAQTYSNLAVLRRDLGQLDEAIAACRQAIALNPRSAEAHSNLGVALKDKGQLEEAVAACRQAIALQPDYAEAYSNLGNALKDAGQLDEAIAACRRSIALKPGNPEAHNNLGNALKDAGQVEAAVAAYRQAVTLKADYVEADNNLVFAFSYHPDYDGRKIAQELARWNLQHAAPLQALIEGHTNDRSPERRLRIGYVSPDFREHPVGRFLLPLLAHHDKKQVEVFAYAQVAAPDAFTAVLRSRTEGWRSTVGLSDAQVAGLVRQDRIDILVDLALHTSGNRLLVFARKPAPVQVTFAGYPGSTGLETIDYRLTDPYLDPPGLSGSSEQWYSEESYRLAESFWCFGAQVEEPPVGPLPAISKGFVTFGCLNNFCKVNDSVLELWAKVLLAVKGSRLIMLAKEGSHRQRTIDFLERQGVAGERVEFRSPRPRKEYLAMYDELDIGLDTLPYNGHTTSLDSFWMGVPVITLVGRTVVGRAGLSQLTNLGLGELAASTAEDFVAIAAKLAGDVAGLGSLRGGLRERMKASPLTDAPRFARGLEAAYRTMWRKWCAAPESRRAERIVEAT